MSSTLLSRPFLASTSLAACLTASPAAVAFGVTDAHGRSTYNAVHQWAADTGFVVIWQLLNKTGMVDFPAPPREVDKDFGVAVQALVTGAAYGHANIYCVPPMEFQPEAFIDHQTRLVYVIGHPTGRRCTGARP
jgi:hypothetical protein